MSRLAKFIEPYLPEVIGFLIFTESIWRKPPRPDRGIAIINTNDKGGGAAKVAFTIAEALQATEKVDMFVRRRYTDTSWVHKLPPEREGRMDYYLQLAEKNGGWLDIAQISPLSLLSDERFRNADILHLHNLHGYFFSYLLLPHLSRGKHVVWTLHDEHVITGHCGMSLRCEQWRKGCGNCPDLSVYPPVKFDRTSEMRLLKERLLMKVKPHLVCPSHWLAERVAQAYPEKLSVSVIPNGIDIDIYRPMSKSSVRAKLGLPQDRFLLVYAAEMGTDNPFKGGTVIRQLAEMLPAQGNISLITIGDRSAPMNNCHIPHPPITDDKAMAELYASADMLIYPTQADNHPLVVLEAMACGLPVVASRVGGIPEIVTNGLNGYLISDHQNPAAFLNQVKEFERLTAAEQDAMSNSAVATIRASFTLEHMIDGYSRLYRKIRGLSE